MNIILRTYTEKDVPIITSIFNEVVNEGMNFISENLVLEHEMELRLKNEQAVYVAEEDEIIKGCYLLRANMKGRGNHIANATYFVSKEFRGQGIGKLMGNHSLKLAKELDYRAMQFNSIVSTNLPSLKLWQSLGFIIVGKIPEGFRSKGGDFIDTLILYKSLLN